MRRLLCLAFTPLLCGACQTAAPVGPVLSAPEPAQPQSVTGASSDLEAGEQLEIVVKTAPELSRTVTIAPDGTIRIPYAGSIPAVGRNLREVEQALRAALASELRDPGVRVFRAAATANRCQPCRLD